MSKTSACYHSSTVIDHTTIFYMYFITLLRYTVVLVIVWTMAVRLLIMIYFNQRWLLSVHQYCSSESIVACFLGSL